jgi:predicted nucleic acid-binding protein
MAVYFADTSFWVALVDRRDAYHQQAANWSRKMSGNIITTEAILLETVNTFSRPDWRNNVIALVDRIMARDDIEVVQFSSMLWDRSWTLFRSRPDKAWSMTDCISFEVMQERGLTEALAADSHFKQAGFRALLLDES